MREMVIYGVSFELASRQPIVLLKTADENRYLPIWVGQAEAAAILSKLQNQTSVRPMTHDLMADVLGELDAELVRIVVTELRENTFYARLTLVQNGVEYDIDSRPSDAIALAVRFGAPIFAAAEVVDENAVAFEGEDGPNEDEEQEIVSEFKRFLDDVSPDEFAAEVVEADDDEDA